ncbi:MAG: MMPL family transporter [Dermatophilaceae bacterium]
MPAGRRSKWVVLLFWLVLAAMAAGTAGKLGDAVKDDSAAWLPGGAESTKVIKAAEQFQDKNELSAIIVYERAAGVKPQDIASVAAQVKKFNALKGVQKDSFGPIPSKDGKALQVLVPIATGTNGGADVIGTSVDEMRTIAKDSSAGLVSHATGPAGSTADQLEAFGGIDGKLLYSAMAVVIFILLLTYRSPVLWLLPVVSAGVALTIAQAAVYLLATHADLIVNSQSRAILMIIVFGAGTDYALLLVARYREELRQHEDRHEAMAYALHRTGPAIFASGTTVIAAMLCLLVATMAPTKGMGPVVAVGIGIGLLVMLTLLPALLVIFGRWFFWPARPSFGSADRTRSGMWSKVGARIARAPRATWVATSLLLVIAALGIGQLNAVGLQSKDTFIGTMDSVVGEQVMAKHFPAGTGDPVMVIAKADHARAVGAAMAGVKGISSVTPPAVKGDLALLGGTLTDPPTGQAAVETVDRVRDAIHKVEGAQAVAGGSTAVRADIQRASEADNKVIMPLILFVVLLILMLLLRAVVAPLILIATVVLSFGGAMGLSAILFRHVFGFAGAESSLPLMVFVFFVALGVDYNIFLMTRVHEEAKQFGTRRGALIGVSATGGVISSAALVLAGTFLVLATMPMVSFAEIGIAIGLGVLIDATVVRLLLVTALNLDVGRFMWWPSRLGKQENLGDETHSDKGVTAGSERQPEPIR